MNLPIVGETLIQLIPQKPPFVFVDALLRVTAQSCTTAFTPHPDNPLVQNGKLSLAGLLEHMAQSAGCKTGFDDFNEGKKPRVAFIGEVKEMHVNRLPETGTTIHTTIEVEHLVFGSVVVVKATSKADEEVLASCKMKVFFETEESEN